MVHYLLRCPRHNVDSKFNVHVALLQICNFEQTPCFLRRCCLLARVCLREMRDYTLHPSFAILFALKCDLLNFAAHAELISKSIMQRARHN